MAGPLRYRASWVLLGVGGLCVAAGVGLADAADLSAGLRAVPARAVVPALLAYAASHALRVLRTLVVLGGAVRSVRLVVAGHAASAVWGLLPFKLGELARIGAIGLAAGGPAQGLRAVWIERTFDAVLLAAGAAVALSSAPGAADAVVPVLLSSVGLLVFTALAVVALPENLSMAKRWIIGRYSAPWSLSALALLDATGDALRALRDGVTGRVATLAALTAGVWAAELAGSWSLAAAVSGRPPGVLLGGLSALSDALVPAAAPGPSLLAWRALVFGALTAAVPLAALPILVHTLRAPRSEEG